MNSSNPRLVGLWVATYPGLKAGPVTCHGCGARVMPRRKCYRLEDQPACYGVRPEVVGFLCRACRKALGPVRKGRYFTQILEALPPHQDNPRIEEGG